MRGDVRYLFPFWALDLDALEELADERGLDGLGGLEDACHLKPCSLQGMEDSGRDPQFWMVWRIAIVLDMPLDELAERVFTATDEERG